tara:strand:+ start:1535 stop:2311 length:777 start_codon:yes stop_codon:yes gene_type:complete
MSQVDRNTLKSYFQAGDKPTEANYADLIDSFALETEVDTKIATVNQTITSLTATVTTAQTKADTNATSILDILARTSALEGYNTNNRLTSLEAKDADLTSRISTLEGNTNIDSFVVACSAEVGNIATGLATTFRLPYAFTLVDVRASLGTASSGSGVSFTVSRNGTVITDAVTIAAGAKTTGVNNNALLGENSAALPLAMDDEISINVTAVGSTTTGSGLKVALVGTAGTCSIVLTPSPIVWPLTFPLSLHTTAIVCS